MTDERDNRRKDGKDGVDSGRHIPQEIGKSLIDGRTIRSAAPPYRWVCPCQEPPVLLATYDPAGRLNIKVRDRYWHLFGFGHVQAICPKCGGEHVLDLRMLRKATGGTDQDEGILVG